MLVGLHATLADISPAIPDIRALTINEQPDLISELEPAFERYNEEQFVTVKLPGGSQQVIISSYSSLGDGRYFDVESSTSFSFDHTTQKASNAQSYVLEGAQADLVYDCTTYSCVAKILGNNRKADC